jgi:hypothetical protein
MQFTGSIADISFDISGKPRATLLINERNDFLDGVDSLRDIKLTIDLKKFRNKRSLNANAYAWLLIGKIADSIRAGKDEVYLKMLKRYGQSELVSVLSHIPVEHYFRYYEEAGESDLNGKSFKHYRVFKGSSEFDTREMSVFIDGICSEAKSLGIQTETPEQIANMVSLWRSANE